MNDLAFGWGNKSVKEMNSYEFEQVSKRLVELWGEIENIKTKAMHSELQFQQLRGKFLAHLRIGEPEDEPLQEKSLNTFSAFK